KLPVFGRFTLGDKVLEDEAFKLQPGEVTAVLGTPQGQVVLKCDRRIPPDKSVKLEQGRPQMVKEGMEEKGQMEMQVGFKELRDKARPQFALKATGQVEDLLAETQRLMSDLPKAVKPK